MRVLIPLPNKDFDPTEVAVPWKVLRSGCEIVFATPDGIKAVPDEIMLNGKGLGIFGPLLKADKQAIHAWLELEKTEEFNHPISYQDASEQEFEGLLLPGGHAQGMKKYLESDLVQKIAKNHFEKKKPTAAICHGILVLARAQKDSGKSLLYGRKITALPKRAELLAWNLTKGKMKNYYRTYPETTVEDEAKEKLKSPADFQSGPPPLVRDSLNRLWAGFVVEDGNLITARWPGDAHLFAYKFKELLA